MEVMKLSKVVVLADYYNRILGKWVKEFIFELECSDMEYNVYLTSPDKKYWQIEDGDDVQLSKKKMILKLQSDNLSTSKPCEADKGEPFYRIVDRLCEVRENIDHLIPQLLEMTKDEAKS